MISKKFDKYFYESVLNNIVKAKYFIFLLFFCEYIQIYIDAMRFSRLLSDLASTSWINTSATDSSYSEYTESDSNSYINFLKYLSIKWLLKSHLKSCYEFSWTNISKRNSTDSNCISAYNNSTVLITISILSFLPLMLFYVIKKAELNNKESIKLVKSKASNSISQRNISSEDYFESDYNYFSILVINSIEIIFTVFGSIITDIFINFIFYYVFYFIHFSDIVNSTENFSIFIYALLIIFGTVCLVIYINANLYYINLIVFGFRFSKQLSLHKDDFFSYRVDTFLLFSKLFFAIEGNLKSIGIQNKYLLVFFYFGYFCLCLIKLVYLVSQLFTQKFIFLINEKYNKLKLFLLLVIINNYFTEFIFQHNYNITIFYFENFIFIVIISIFLTEVLIEINRKFIFGLARIPSGIMYQVIFIIDYFYNNEHKSYQNFLRFSKNKKSDITEQLMLKLFLSHKFTCTVQACKIKQIKKFSFISFFDAFVYEMENPLKIHKIKSEDFKFLELIRLVISEMISKFIENKKGNKNNFDLKLNKKSEVKNKEKGELKADEPLNKTQAAKTEIKSSLIRLVYASSAFIRKNSNNANFYIFIISVFTNKLFKANQKEFISFEVINLYQIMNNKIQKSLYFIDETISCVKTKNFKTIFDLIIHLSIEEAEINRSYSIIVKNKNIYVDYYTLYITTFLYREIFNNKLRSENEIIFSNEMNLQINNSFYSDNYFILSTNQNRNYNVMLETSLTNKHNSNDTEDISALPKFANLKIISEKQTDSNNSFNDYSIRIIKTTNKFILYKNKFLENLFPKNLRNEIASRFNSNLASSDGKKFLFSTVLEYEFYKNPEDSELDKNAKDKKEMLNKNNIAAPAARKVIENKNETKADFKVDKNTKENPNQITNTPNRIQKAGTVSKGIINNTNNIIELNKPTANNNNSKNAKNELQRNCQVCKLDSRIYPSLALNELFIVSNVNILSEDIIIFQEDERNQAEHIVNLSDNISKIINLPFSFLKIHKENNLGFDKIFKYAIENTRLLNNNHLRNQVPQNTGEIHEQKNNHLIKNEKLINNFNSNNIKAEEYQKFHLDINQYHNLLINFIDKLREKDTISLEDEGTMNFIKNFEARKIYYQKRNTVNKHVSSSNINENKLATFSENQMDNNNNNNNLKNTNFLKGENKATNPASLHNAKINFLIALFDVIKTKNFMYKIFKIKLSDMKTNSSINESAYFDSNRKDSNLNNIFDNFDNNSVLNASIGNGSSETSFTINVLEMDYINKKNEKSKMSSSNPVENKLLKSKHSNSNKIQSYLYLILVFIGLFVISGIVFLILGILKINKIKKLFFIDYLFNDFTTFLFHTQINLTVNLQIYEKHFGHHPNFSQFQFFNKFVTAGVDLNITDYILKESETKLMILKALSNDIKNLIFALDDAELNSVILYQKIDYFYIVNNLMENSSSNNDSNSSKLNPDNKLKVTSKKIYFFELMDIYHSFASSIIENSSDYFFCYIIDNSELKFSFKNFDNINFETYQSALYHLNINYPNIVFIFEIYKEYINDKFNREIDDFYFLIFNYYIAINLCHVILIFIAIFTMKVFKEIVCQNICLMELTLDGEKYLTFYKKLKRLKSLSELYLENPYELIKKLVSSKKLFYSNTDNNKNKSKFNNKSFKLSSRNLLVNPNNESSADVSNNNPVTVNITSNDMTFPSIPISLGSDKLNSFVEKDDLNMYVKGILEEKAIFLEKSNLLKPIYTFLWVIFISYYIYSNLLFFIFNSINNQVVYYNILAQESWKTSHDLYNNALFLSTSILLNQSDYISTVFWDKQNTIYNPQYNSTGTKISLKSPNSYYLFNSLNSVLKQNFKSIKNAKESQLQDQFNKYYYEYVDCELIYKSFNDGIIMDIASNKNSTFPNLLTDLTKTCQFYDFNKEKNVYLITEELTYRNKYLYNKFQFSDFTYNRLKFIYDDDTFFDISVILLLIYRPIDHYINSSFILPVVNMNINNYLIFNVCYLVFNFLIDVLLFYFINKNITQKVLKINEDFKLINRSLQV